MGFGQVTTSTISGVVKNSTTVATITVASVSGIRPGHHVQLSSISGSTQLNFRNSLQNNYLVTSVTPCIFSGISQIQYKTPP